MARFIKLFDGSYVNVDIIGSLVPKTTSDEEPYFEVYNKERRSLGGVGYGDFDPNIAGATVIKAEPGFSLIRVSINFANDQFEIILHPIIAWSIINNTLINVTPICFAPELADCRGSDEAILFPNGEVKSDGEEWESLNAYRKHLKTEYARLYPSAQDTAK